MTVNVLDPELPLLASQAAIELDAMSSGHSVDISAIKQLADRLKSALGDCTTWPSQRALHADTATVTVLGQAMRQAIKYSVAQKVDTIEELAQRTSEIADRLSNLTDGNGDLQWPIAFCLALSRCASAYRKSVLDIQRPHPFRR